MIPFPPKISLFNRDTGHDQNSRRESVFFCHCLSARRNRTSTVNCPVNYPVNYPEHYLGSCLDRHLEN